MNNYLTDFWQATPIVSLAIFALLTLIVDAAGKDKPVLSYWMSLIGIVVAAGFSVASLGASTPLFNTMLAQGGYSSYCNLIFLGSAFLCIVLSRNYLERLQYHRGEFYVLIILATVGMMLMAAALDLMIIFLGIELMSICLYVLAGFIRKKEKANESSLKYFLLGAFATGFLLYGIALIYGTAGTTNLALIGKSFPQLSHNSLFMIGAGMLIVAFSFKVAAVPFHMWAPDVYEGSPTTISAFMSTGAKAAAFAVFVSVFIRTFDIGGTKLSDVLAIIAAVSMIVGNVTAIAQNNLKRMLAYSSIAHAGYMLSGIAAGNIEGETGILFYLSAYVFMNIGAFGIISWMEQQDDKKLTFDDYAGLSSQHPAVAALMAIFMFSLAGIPPFAGFFGKYYVFLAAVKAGMTWLAIIGVLTSLISVYYYLRLVVLMYFRDGQASIEEKVSAPAMAAISCAALFLIVLGLYPSLVVDIAKGFFKI
ncbi:MAG: NADH-quinone oxidoreductase subunit N [Ignavibacteriales bacterium]|nr:NADH-quinone oxidoreductase subunit N [Ignavibacteriales bacterium]